MVENLITEYSEWANGCNNYQISNLTQPIEKVIGSDQQEINLCRSCFYCFFKTYF